MTTNPYHADLLAREAAAWEELQWLMEDLGREDPETLVAREYWNQLYKDCEDNDLDV